MVTTNIIVLGNWLAVISLASDPSQNCTSSTCWLQAVNGQLPGFGSGKESEETITELEKTTEKSTSESTAESINEVEKTTEVAINQVETTTQESDNDLEVTTQTPKAEDNLEFGENNPDTDDVTSNVWADPDVEVFTTEIFNAQTVQDLSLIHI